LKICLEKNSLYKNRSTYFKIMEESSNCYKSKWRCI